MKIKVILLLSVLFYFSCGKCGENKRLGAYNLAESSRQHIPYSGSETLIFEDNEGIRYRLTSNDGRILLDSRLIVRELCEEGMFDQQYEYYDSQREQIAYFDSIGNQIFYMDLFTHFEDAADLDSIAIFDYLLVNTALKGSFNGQIDIVATERQNQVSDRFKNEVLNHSTFLGDTTLYGEPFTNVYVGTSGEDKSIYYNKTRGVLAFRISEEEYWVLKN